MKFYTKHGVRLLEDLERRTRVTWSCNDLPTRILYRDMTDEDVYISYNCTDDGHLGYCEKSFYESHGLYELTNDGFVRYVESILPKDRTVYDLEYNDVFWYISIDGDVYEDIWKCYIRQFNMREIGNCYLTEAEAIEEVERLKECNKRK